ncbi:MAG: hypothetical protein K8T10_13445 [Candidatus Eremiobacteraeota bacterium]|nr:hypothetical protein [Candidatus Eremiobacteraeota bacterium]
MKKLDNGNFETENLKQVLIFIYISMEMDVIFRVTLTIRQQLVLRQHHNLLWDGEWFSHAVSASSEASRF